MRSHSRQNDASVWFPGWRSVRKQALHDTRRTILSRGSILFGLVLGALPPVYLAVVKLEGQRAVEQTLVSITSIYHHWCS